MECLNPEKIIKYQPSTEAVVDINILVDIITLVNIEILVDIELWWDDNFAPVTVRSLVITVVISQYAVPIGATKIAELVPTLWLCI